MIERRLSEIWIYPIKSMGGIQLDHGKVLDKGLQYDRRWMLVDENGVFLSQRSVPQMALFKLIMENASVVVQFGSEKLSIPIDQYSTKTWEVKIWDDVVTANTVNDEVSDWFTHCLKMKCSLVHLPESASRPVDLNYKLNNEQVSFADAYPFLIIGQASLDLLNSKLKSHLPMNRFRPNFVFTGSEPNEEDSWKDISIGTNRFIGVKNCARCVLTTVDQATATKGDEPLRTLATYRRKDNKIYFGRNFLAVDHQQVKVGDFFTIQSKAL